MTCVFYSAHKLAELEKKVVLVALEDLISAI